MKIGHYRVNREYPSERALRKWGELTPDLRELILRAVRAIAKDQVQEILEQQNRPYRNTTWIWGRSAIHPCGHSIYTETCEMFQLEEVDEYQRWVATLPEQEKSCES